MVYLSRDLHRSAPRSRSLRPRWRSARSEPVVANGRVMTVNEAAVTAVWAPPIGHASVIGAEQRSLSQRVGQARRMSVNGGEHAWTAEGRISRCRRSETETGIETCRLDVDAT